MLKLSTVCVLLACLWVQSAQGVFDSAAQTDLIGRALNEYYAIDDGALEIVAVAPLASLEVAPKSLELVELPEHPASTLPIKVRYTAEGGTATTVAATFRAQWRQEGLVARSQIARGTAVDAAQLEVKSIDRLSTKQIPVPADAKLSEYEIVSAVSAGGLLTWNNLRARPLIKKGSLVDVIAQEGGLKITSRAVALQDAGRGEPVVMRNTSSNRQFEAYVINENLVQIRF